MVYFFYPIIHRGEALAVLRCCCYKPFIHIAL